MATGIICDHKDFFPEALDVDNGEALVKANIAERLVLPQKAIAVVDAGIEVGLPAGFRLKLVSEYELGIKGLFIANCRMVQGKRYQRIEAVVMNLGREIINIDPKQPFAVLGVEQSLGFVWQEQNV